MVKKIVLLVFAVVLASCGAKKKVTATEGVSVQKEVNVGTDTLVSYKSLGNGVASIGLQLFTNGTFQFDLISIPQPEDGGDAIEISERGTYVSEGSLKTLKFRNPKFSLSALFDTNYGDSSQFKVIDDSTVQINTSRNTLTIWGVACEKL